MQDYILIGSVLAIHFFAWLTPGPMIVLIIRNSLVYSRKTGFWTAAGFAVGNFVHIILAVTGIGIIIAGNPLAHNTIKFLGVGYLIYLGLKTFLVKPKLQNAKTEHKHRDIPHLSAARIGLAANLLSPGAYLFFISIFGSLLSSKAPYWVVAFLLLAMPLNTLMMASLWSVFLTHRNIQTLYTKYQTIFNKCLGAALIILALLIVFKK